MSKMGVNEGKNGEVRQLITDVDYCSNGILISEFGGMFAKVIPPGLRLMHAEEREVQRLQRLENERIAAEQRASEYAKLKYGTGNSMVDDARLILALARNGTDCLRLR